MVLVGANVKQVFKKDRYVLGHHGGGKFRSAREFFPHFVYLLIYPDEGVCGCKLCSIYQRKRDQELLRATAQTHFTAESSDVDEERYDGDDEDDDEGEHGVGDDYELEASDGDTLSLASTLVGYWDI